ncbi:N-acetylglucosamine-6-phosphate deacetylase [Halotalea alkalilenta]|uniref:N-acetylglucosamine-6-phosphate deacetylase n=1 Tax=Halotalea alkalilenta TaxID=376489 RepID=UPI000484165F|nr:N-acetylglucosamine-6-phosphate deacetylase [Halotalea alkalilenta]
MRLQGHILTPEGWCLGQLECDAGRILSITPDASLDPRQSPWLLPGFIDLHVHGGGGLDAMQAGEAAAVLARTHARFGTTSLLVTTMTAAEEELLEALAAVSRAIESPEPGRAEILGVHLEGPFINPAMLGAQPPRARAGTIEAIERYRALAPIRLVTLAPEIEGHRALIEHLRDAGIRVQIGHTCASYRLCVEALGWGVSGFTHLYNAMTPLHHRSAGAVGAALAHADFCEVIPDLVHVEEGAMRVAMRAIPRLYAVTDATAAAGMPDGQYKLGEHDVYKHSGAVRLANGTLAGSTLTMDQALRNFMSLGESLARASLRLSTWPADYLGLDDRGRLAPGLRADLVVLDETYALREVYVGGERVPSITDHY